MSILTSSCHLCILISCVSALIIPEELPSILSVIYSNIPPITKGTDSRVGVGFRLGNHADFQVLLELGPQQMTDQLPTSEDSKRRRQVHRPLLYAQALASSSTDKVADTPGGKWLSSWKSGFLNPKFNKDPTAEVQVIQNPMAGKEHIATHLQQLYKKTEDSNNGDKSEARTAETDSSTTSTASKIEKTGLS